MVRGDSPVRPATERSSWAWVMVGFLEVKAGAPRPARRERPASRGGRGRVREGWNG